jgi:hypothetical protein
MARGFQGYSCIKTKLIWKELILTKLILGVLS